MLMTPRFEKVLMYRRLMVEDLIWFNLCFKQKMCDRFRVRPCRDASEVNSSASKPNVAVRFRQGGKAVSLEDCSHAGCISFRHFINSDGKGCLNMLLIGEPTNERVLRAASAQLFLKNRQRVIRVNVPSIWKHLHVACCLPEVANPQTEEGIRDFTRDPKNGLLNTVPAIHFDLIAAFDILAHHVVNSKNKRCSGSPAFRAKSPNLQPKPRTRSPASDLGSIDRSAGCSTDVLRIFH
jgi:hypothetical protein